MNLKPCPFCGGEAELTRYYELRNGKKIGISKYFVECQKCNSKGRSFQIFKGVYTEKEQSDKAERSWNKRTYEYTCENCGDIYEPVDSAAYDKFMFCGSECEREYNELEAK